MISLHLSHSHFVVPLVSNLWSIPLSSTSVLLSRCQYLHFFPFLACFLHIIHQIHCCSFSHFYFSCAFLLFSVYSVLSFYSCNYPLGHYNEQVLLLCSRAHSKRDGTRAETRFVLSAKRTSPFKSAGGGSVQSTTGSRGVRIDHVPMYSARLLATHSIHIFPLNFPSLASPCAITFRTACTCYEHLQCTLT